MNPLNHQALSFANQLRAFTEERFGVSLSTISEDPHILAFLDHCVSRPVRFTSEGALAEGPIRATLVKRLLTFAKYGKPENANFRITDLSVRHARGLADKHAKSNKGANAITPTALRHLVAGINTAAPLGKRNKAAILSLWQTWGRPRELLLRRYPEEICADYDRGVVITVPNSKTNDGPDPEYFLLEHESDKAICPVCALRKWIDWLGPDYRGPLFPTMSSRLLIATGQPMKTKVLRRRLQELCVRTGHERNAFSPYSFRKGPATTAAAQGWRLGDIRKRLRHQNIFQSLGYVDRPVLFELMRRAIG
jgi:hypothetical protein